MSKSNTWIPGIESMALATLVFAGGCTANKTVNNVPFNPFKSVPGINAKKDVAAPETVEPPASLGPILTNLKDRRLFPKNLESGEIYASGWGIDVHAKRKYDTGKKASEITQEAIDVCDDTLSELDYIRNYQPTSLSSGLTPEGRYKQSQAAARLGTANPKIGYSARPTTTGLSEDIWAAIDADFQQDLAAAHNGTLLPAQPTPEPKFSAPDNVTKNDEHDYTRDALLIAAGAVGAVGVGLSRRLLFAQKQTPDNTKA